VLPGESSIKFSSVLRIVALSAVLAAGIEWKYRADIELATERYRKEAYADSLLVKTRTEGFVNQIYQGLRTMARLPGVRGIDRNAESFQAHPKRSVQEIYNNLASNVSMSKVYIVLGEPEPQTVDPTTGDPKTGQPQTAVLTFDQLLLEKSGDQSAAEKDAGGGSAKVEIFEDRIV